MVEVVECGNSEGGMGREYECKGGGVMELVMMRLLVMCV